MKTLRGTGLSLGLALLTTTCQLGDLVKPTAPGRLAASPMLLTDSALVGSSAGRNQSLSITSDGAARMGWRASVVHSSQWVELARSQDTVPATLTIMLRPGALAVGTYRDTIQLSGDTDNDQVRIPVVFTIHGASTRPPSNPGSPGQFRIDGTTTIAVGGFTTERTVIFRATLSDPDAGDSLRLEGEVQPIGIPFSNVPNAVSAQVASGATASAAVTGLSDYTSYHWQARVLDKTGERSAWIVFGGNGESEADFRVVLPPTRLVFLTEPGNTPASAAITPAVRVAVQDAGGSTLSYFAGNISVALSNNPSGGHLTGTTTVAAVNGIATFADLRIERTGLGYTLAASSAGLPGVTSAAFDIVAGTAATVVFSTQPSNAAAGAPITPSVRVTALDASGNLAAGFGGSVTLTIASNPATGTLSGTVTANAVSGVATFSTLSINRAGNGYTLRAAATGLTAVVSSTFNIAAAAVSASQSSLTAAPASIPANAGTATSTITVTARDPSGNALTGATVALAATGTGNILTPASGTTGATGVITATFSSTGAGAKTITATINGVAVTQTATVTVTVGAASRVGFTVQPGATVAAAAMTPGVQVAAQDAFGNTVAGFAGNVTIAIGTNPAAGVLSGTLTVAAAAGVATFSNLSIDRAGIGYTLIASSTGLTGATSAPFNVTTGVVSAAQSSVAVAPATLVASSGASTVTITVTARNASGATIAGVLVALTSTGTGNVFTPASGTTNASGVLTATFSSTIAQPKTISASLGGTAITQTATVTVTPAAANALFFTAQPGNTAAGATITPAVAVTARDAFGNNAAAFTGNVTIAIGTNPAAGALTGTPTAAAVSGVASFSNLRISPVGTGYTLTASSAGLTGATSSAFNITP